MLADIGRCGSFAAIGRTHLGMVGLAPSAACPDRQPPRKKWAAWTESLDDDESVSLYELWLKVRKILDEARAHLTNPDDDGLFLFEEFLGHNELGLALDALADVAAEQRAPSTTWRALAAAAKTMDLTEHDPVHGGTVRIIRSHVNAAPEWRGLQRLLNEWDPIGVVPELGGPGDEYDCMLGPLLTMLSGGSSEREIGLFLRTELSDHFGLNPNYSHPEMFAARVLAWWSVERDS